MTALVRAIVDADEAWAWPIDPNVPERFTVVGWWCDRGTGPNGAPGHFVTTPERTGNVPILVPAECADDVRALLSEYADGDN